MYLDIEELLEENTSDDAGSTPEKAAGSSDQKAPPKRPQVPAKPGPDGKPRPGVGPDGKPRPKGAPPKPGQKRPPGAGPRPSGPPKKKMDDKAHKFSKNLKVIEQKPEDEKRKKKKMPPKKRKPKVNIEELKPEIARVDKLKKRKPIEIKQLKKLMKKKNTPISSKHLSSIKRGLETPRYKVSPKYGLTYEIIDKRTSDGLANFNITTVGKTYKRIVFTNVFTFFNLITLGIAGWLVTVAAFADLMFAVIVLANIGIGIYQEIKAKKTMEEMSVLSTTTVNVMRQGEKVEILVTDVVLDDIVVLEPGYQIPTDSKLVEGNVEVNESMLTGESDAVVKKPGDMLYGGSYVVSGVAKIQVEHIGKDNYIEKLTTQVKHSKKAKSELLSSLTLVVNIMSIAIIFLGAILFYTQFILNEEVYREAVRNTVGAMAGMIPAGLFLVSSMALYIGVIKLADFNVLVRELYCIEMLAKISVLCLDKTGTITDGTMKVKNVVEYRSVPGLTTRCIISAMMNSLNDRNQTSVALETKFGLGKRIKHNALMPFNSARKYSSVEFAKYGTFVMGAPEIVLRHNFGVIQKDVEKFSKLGVRLILIAHTTAKIVNDEIDLTTCSPVSMVLIEDNIRPDAIDTIAYFKRSGVRVKVISGDNPMTVSKISERAGIDDSERYISLDGMKEEEVIKSASKYTVFGRVSPAQKALLIKTMKKQGETVAMTGDGVNDILALKEADCSIAVASGSDAARSVSHLVLLDSNFSSMPRVVSEGRRVINNIAKVATLFLTRSLFSLFLALQAIGTGGQFPLTPIQFLMIEILVISIPSLVIVLEPNNAKLEGKFLSKILKDALPGSVAILVISLITFALATPLNLDARQISTIIAISVTFAMFMVLFDIMTPLNKIRKNLFSTMFTLFLFFTLLFPVIFNFSPILSFNGYFDEHLVTVANNPNPNIQHSQNNRLVIDNVVTNTIITDHDAEEVIVNHDGTISTRGITTGNSVINLPSAFSNALDSQSLVLDAHVTTVRVFANTDTRVMLDARGRVILQVNYNGNNPVVPRVNHHLSINGIRPFTVLPTIGRTPNGYLIIDHTVTDIRHSNQVETVALEQPANGLASLNAPERYFILINGQRVSTQEYPEGLYVATPIISIAGDEGDAPEFPGTSLDPIQTYSIGGLITELDNRRYEVSIEDFTISPTGFVYLNEEATMVNLMPNVSVSRAGFWIVDGILTQYESDGARGRIQTRFNDDFEYYKLIINGQLTHITIDVLVVTGGYVPQLPLPQLMLLLLLCAISLPLVRLMKEAPAFTKHYYKLVKSLIKKDAK